MLAELHLHLEGSIEPETLLEINPSLSLPEVEENFQFSDFAGFLRSYVWVNRQLREPEHYAIAARRCFRKLADQGVVYAEITISIGVVLWKEQNVHGIIDALTREAAEAPLQIRWVFDAIRQFGAEPAMRVAEIAVERKNEGVVAFGIGGDEVNGPAEWFRDVFTFTTRNGLALVPHAGEVDGPASVWACVELGACRIGHGIRAAEDPELMRRLRDDDIPLEVCITSNVCTGAVPSIEAHPVRRLYDAGVPVIINTDDPALFRTSLLAEYAIARDRFGIPEAEIKAAGLRYALEYRPTSFSSASSSLPASDHRP
ncbi:MAG TPA: adenosine deaminase [Bryobacteraceae bacterium]|nr:adenosine deaminase [Bryobacteraceae bacterium]